jgi:cytochrome c oxidase cbb3-type subunit 3
MKPTNKIKLFIFLLINLLFVSGSFAQAATAGADTNSGIDISVDTILCIIAILLLFIILVLASTLNGAIDLYKSNHKNNSGNTTKTVALLGLLFLSQYAFSQDATTATTVAKEGALSGVDIYFYGFLTVILIELGIILYIIKSLRFLTGIEQMIKDKAASGESLSWWEKINKLKSLKDEASVDMGHDFDGIRELDNVTPPWFTISFLATIVIAIIYLYQFNISGTIPHQEDEFAAEMKIAQAVQDSLMKLEGNKFDENSVTMLGADDIAAGKKTFTANCSACHGDKGQGGVGPNLTDEYWLHGGSIKDVFHTIKYGYVEKGMKSWKDDFSPKQIAQLASFVESLKGTNPPGAKVKQGELYKGDDATATK